MNNRNEKRITSIDRSGIGEFHQQFGPYVGRIFRDALILTGSPKAAKKLQTEVYLKAFANYLQTDGISNFEGWLSNILADCFGKYVIHTQRDDGGSSARVVMSN